MAIHVCVAYMCVLFRPLESAHVYTDQHPNLSSFSVACCTVWIIIIIITVMFLLNILEESLTVTVAEVRVVYKCIMQSITINRKLCHRLLFDGHTYRTAEHTLVPNTSPNTSCHPALSTLLQYRTSLVAKSAVRVCMNSHAICVPRESCRRNAEKSGGANDPDFSSGLIPLPNVNEFCPVNTPARRKAKDEVST